MLYKSEKQKIALQKQVKYLQKFNRLFDKQQELEIKEFYISGLSCNQIADKYSCSKSPILRIIKNLPKRKSTDYKQHKCHNQYGKANPAWKGGIKSVYERIRDLKSYWDWRNSVLIRDNSICTNCEESNNLEVHHKITLKSLIINLCDTRNCLPKDLTFEDLNSDYFYNIDNGTTLCKSCHKRHHKINGRK